MNNTTTLKCLWNNDGFRFIELMLYVAILCVSLLGNILVIVVVYRNKSMRSATNYFIVNMAVSDLFIPIILIPRVMKEISAKSPAWAVGGLTGEILCKVVFFLSDATPLVSILSLIFISWDRFCAVIFPLRNKSCIPRWFLIGLTWFISFGVLAPYFYTFQLYEFDGQVYCVQSWSPAFDHAKAHQIYTTFMMVAFIITPFFMLSFIYIVICIAIINHKVVGNTMRSERGRAIRDRKTRTVVKLAFTIVLACALCFGPVGVMILLKSFKFDWKDIPDEHVCSWGFWWAISQLLAHSNAAVNPTIYFVFVQSYKRELKRILSYVRSPFPGHSGATGVAVAGPQQMEMNQLLK